MQVDIIDSNTNVHELYVQSKQDDRGISNAPKKYSTDASISYGGGVNIKLLSQSDIN